MLSTLSRGMRPKRLTSLAQDLALVRSETALVFLFCRADPQDGPHPELKREWQRARSVETVRQQLQGQNSVTRYRHENVRWEYRTEKKTERNPNPGECKRPGHSSLFKAAGALSCALQAVPGAAPHRRQGQGRAQRYWGYRSRPTVCKGKQIPPLTENLLMWALSREFLPKQPA